MNTKNESAAKDRSSIRKKFTAAEDELLKQLVEKFGTKKWESIAECMPGRTGRQCRDRYRNYLIPGFFNGQWTAEEDRLLLVKYKELGHQWSKMVPFFTGRSANSLKNRWNYFVCRFPEAQESFVVQKFEPDLSIFELEKCPPVSQSFLTDPLEDTWSFMDIDLDMGFDSFLI